MFDFAVFPMLKTQRLRLRQIIMSDVAGVFAIRSDYAVTRYNSGAAYTKRQQARKLIDQMQQSYAAQRSIRWGITMPPANTVIGMIGYNYWDRDDHRGSVGFDLARAYWRRGIMSEALQAVICFGFNEMGLNRIEGDASVYNVASIALMEKLGLVREGLQREQYYEDGAYHDLVLLALIKREWDAAKCK